MSPPAEAAEETMVRKLASEFGLSASPSDVEFIDSPPSVSEPWAVSRAWVLANVPGEKHDVFLVHARRAPEGGLLQVNDVFNVSDTRAAQEERLRASGGLAAWTVGDHDRTYSVHIANADHGPDLPSELAPLQTGQLRLTWWQETGQWAGVAQRQFKLDPPATELWLRARDSQIDVWADGHTIEIPALGPPRHGARYVSEHPHYIARPGNLITWAVDRARRSAWFGDEKLQLLKAIAYRVLDRFDLAVQFLLPESPEQNTREEFTAHLEQEFSAAPAPESTTTDHWPPPPLPAVLDPPFEGEGQWVGLERDPFVRKLPNGRSPFLTTFLRTDRQRKFSRIVIALWDARWVELHMQSGTEEPKTATGEHGTGLVPRDPDMLERFVGAFNGGFQGSHGDFGMMVDRTLFVPPKPYAATVARLRDGSTGFGTWPENLAIPEELSSFRQNLTPLIVEQEINPYGRLWWGGVPEGWEDDTRTVRSGLCLTVRGHIAYLYGAKVDHRHLAIAMRSLECEYGMHLDMNQGHTGLEFYHVAPEQELPTLGMPLDGMWQAEGNVEGAPGYRFRGRRLFKSMQLMNFPRYIQRESRDFFYLAVRHLLPGAPLGPAADEPPSHVEQEGLWHRKGLPEQTFPYSLVRTVLRPDPAARPETKVHVLKLDPARVESAGNSLSPTTLFTLPTQPSGSGTQRVFWHAGRVSFARQAPASGAALLAQGSTDPTLPTVAALGLERHSRFLIYAEVGTARDRHRDGMLLDALLTRAGCEARVFLDAPWGVALAGQHDLSGHPHPLEPNIVAWRPASLRGFRRIFNNTPVVQRSIWRPLQKREEVPTSE